MVGHHVELSNLKSNQRITWQRVKSLNISKILKLTDNLTKSRDLHSIGKIVDFIGYRHTKRSSILDNFPWKVDYSLVICT